jgi:hypothetical protein
VWQTILTHISHIVEQLLMQASFEAMAKENKRLTAELATLKQEQAGTESFLFLAACLTFDVHIAPDAACTHTSGCLLLPMPSAQQFIKVLQSLGAWGRQPATSDSS